MMQRLLLLGLNHSTAPLKVRERIAFDPAARAAALAAFRMRYPRAEMVLLSTCNRVEMYIAKTAADHPDVQAMTGFLARHHGIAAADFQTHLYEKSGRDVVMHLFRVAASLDSMVLGETQILGQVREAYEAARDVQSAGPLLHPLFQRAMSVGKQVQARTDINEGRLSIASVAVEYARRLFDRFDDRNVLFVGAGKMGLLALRHFAGLSPRRLMVCTRDARKAHRVAAAHSGVGVSMEQLADSLAVADVVVCSTGSPQPLITREMFEQVHKARRGRPIFFIDIALPRDVDERVGRLEQVHLYNLDDLQQAVSATRESRREAIAAADSLIVEAVEEYVAWQRTRELGPMIERLYERYHRLAREEVDRTLVNLPGASAGDRRCLEELARRLVNKMLHHPVQSLRYSATLHGPASRYLHAVEKLFCLDGQGGESSQDG